MLSSGKEYYICILCALRCYWSLFWLNSVYSFVTALPIRRHSRAYAEPFCTLTQCHRNGQSRLAQFTEGSSWCSAELGGFKCMFPGRYIVVLCSVCLLVISSAAYIADCLSGFSALFSLSSVMYVCIIGRRGAKWRFSILLCGDFVRWFARLLKPLPRALCGGIRLACGDFVQYFRLFVLSAGWLYTAAGKAIRQRGFLPRRLPFDRWIFIRSDVSIRGIFYLVFPP